MRHTLICTVGTSLLSNLKYENDLEVQSLLKAKNWHKLSLWLLKKDNNDRVCGAEINSISSIIKKGFLEQTQNIILLVSDTDDGRDIGKLLESYYSNNQNPIKFEKVNYRDLKGLRDDDVVAFKREGLRNLVKEISEKVSQWDSSSIAINATGGYKAQISFAGMIGQALDIPVYYLFEKFSEIIELPPQPISLDLAFWLQNNTVFDQLETEEIVNKSSLDTSIEDARWSTLIDEVPDEDDCLITLSAMGVLFNAQARLQFKRQETAILSSILKDETPAHRKQISLRDDHGKDILQAFCDRLCRSPYVVRIINSLPFNPRQRNPIKKCTEDGLIDFVLTWTDPGLGLCIKTTGKNKIETNTIAIHLQDKYTV